MHSLQLYAMKLNIRKLFEKNIHEFNNTYHLFWPHSWHRQHNQRPIPIYNIDIYYHTNTPTYQTTLVTSSYSYNISSTIISINVEKSSTMQTYTFTCIKIMSFKQEIINIYVHAYLLPMYWPHSWHQVSITVTIVVHHHQH